MSQRARFIGGEIYRRSRYGGKHPLAIPRVSLAMDLCRALGWLPDDLYVEAVPATPAQLARFHDPDYIAAVADCERMQSATPEQRARFGLGANGNPVFGEVFRRLIGYGIGLRAGGTEDADLPQVPVGVEDFVRVAHLPHRAVEELQIAHPGAVTADLQARHEQSGDEVTFLRILGPGSCELFKLLVQRDVARGAARLFRQGENAAGGEVLLRAAGVFVGSVGHGNEILRRVP